MRKSRTARSRLGLAALVLLALPAGPGRAAGQPELESTMELLPSDNQAGDLRLEPAPDIPLPHYIGDWSASQALELIRPEMAALTVKRLTTSCSCLRASLEKKTFAKGERVVLTVRNVKKTPPNGAHFAVFMELEAPERRIVEGKVFVRSNAVPNH